MTEPPAEATVRVQGNHVTLEPLHFRGREAGQLSPSQRCAACILEYADRDAPGHNHGR